MELRGAEGIERLMENHHLENWYGRQQLKNLVCRKHNRDGDFGVRLNHGFLFEIHPLSEWGVLLDNIQLFAVDFYKHVGSWGGILILLINGTSLVLKLTLLSLRSKEVEKLRGWFKYFVIGWMTSRYSIKYRFQTPHAPCNICFSCCRIPWRSLGFDLENAISWGWIAESSDIWKPWRFEWSILECVIQFING